MTPPDTPKRPILRLGRLIHRYREAKRPPLPEAGGDLDGALALHRQTEQICRETGDREGLAHSLGSQALILQDRGDLDRASTLHQSAQQLYREFGNTEAVVATLDKRAAIIRARGDFDGAISLYEEAEALYRELGNQDGAADSLHRQMEMLREQRDLDRMLELLALLLFSFQAEARQLSFAPFHSSGIYNLGERAGWTISAHGAAPATQYVFEIRKNNFDMIQSGALSFATGRATIETTVEEPAMLYVTVWAEGSPPASAIHLGAAIAPKQLMPSVPRPGDFDSFWDAKLHELSGIPLNSVATPIATGNGVELARAQVDGWRSHVHGYLARPVTEGTFPALVMFQYAGVYAIRPSTVIKRAAEGWLAFDVASHDHPPDDATSANSNYEAIGNTDRESSYFLKMYLRAVRALDYIAGHPAWDGKTLVVMGTCMGGQQALVSAALRPRVTAVIANQPSGADCNGKLHGRKAGYPYWPSRDPKAMATAPYFDIVNFAPRIQAPVLASMGFIDTTSPPAGIWTFLNQMPGPKEIITMIELDHTNRTPDKRGVFRSRASEVLGILRQGGEFKPNSPQKV